MDISNIIEKVTHSKCPSCKKYGIGALRGIGHHCTYVVTCKYCGRKFRLNSALAVILSITVPLFFGLLGLIIQSIFNFEYTKAVVILLSIIMITAFYVIIRSCPMEEEPEKAEDEPGFTPYNIDGVTVTASCRDKALAYTKNGKVHSISFQEIKYKDFDETLLGICKKLIQEGRLSAFEYVIEYVLRYDRDFATTYISRYAAGGFTRDEILKSKKINTEYIAKYAKQLTAELSSDLPTR